MRAIAVLLAFVLPAVAGCIQGERLDEGTTASTASVQEPVVVSDPTSLLSENASASVEAPLWQVGNAWQVEGYWGAETTPCTLVVVSSEGPYQLAPTCDGFAIDDAVYDVSFVGPIRVDDLAGAQQGTPIKFFDFPLEDEKTWSTLWDGMEVTLTATRAPVLMAPGAGAGPGFTIVGTTSEGKTYVTYDYAPGIRWWTKLAFEEGYGFRVKGFQESYSGPYKVGAATKLLDLQPPVAGVLNPAGTFTVSEGQSALVVSFHGAAEGYAVAAHLVDPAGGVAYSYTGAEQAGSFWSEATLEPTPGQWTASTVGSYSPGYVSFSAFEVLLEERTLP